MAALILPVAQACFQLPLLEVPGTPGKDNSRCDAAGDRQREKMESAPDHLACVPRYMLTVRSAGATPTDQVDQDGNHGDHQEDVDEAAHGIGGNEAQEPHDDEYDGDGVEHGEYPFQVELDFPRSRKRANPALIGFLATDRGFTPRRVLPNSIPILRYRFRKFRALAYTLRNFLPWCRPFRTPTGGPPLEPSPPASAHRKSSSCSGLSQNCRHLRWRSAPLVIQIA
jgi:hypothetical protein